MKLRQPWLITAIAFVGAWIIRLWIWTVRSRYYTMGPDVRPNQPGLKQHYIYVFWHENLLLPAYHFGRPDVFVLISRHADGQLIAEVCRRLGFGLARGSTTRGGVEAVRQMLRLGKDAHLAVTPDGPQGPRRHVQPGVAYLAARTGLPIAPVGIAYRRPWRMGSWDRFAIPRPWSVGAHVVAPPIWVPADADLDELEHYRRLLEDSLHWATEMAEQWVAGDEPRPPVAAVAA
ncbi:MAG TPA: lysophospholipid acyltransferase family protein [Gemmataceae bacterium]|nr:lysophospholipid acyltransferase family protein [Gemmataceae bacterium]